MTNNTDSKVDQDQGDTDTDRRGFMSEIFTAMVIIGPILYFEKVEDTYSGRIVVDSSKSDYIESVGVSLSVNKADLTVNLKESKNISALVVNMDGEQYNYGVVGSGQSVVELVVGAQDIADNKIELLVVSGGRLESTGGLGSKSYYTGGQVLEKIPITME